MVKDNEFNIINNEYVEMKVYNKKEECFIYKISIEDLEAVKKYKWYKHSCNYLKAYINKDGICLHTYLMNFKNVDHIDRDRTNNMRNNLRKSTQEENSYNKSNFKNNKTGIKGVGYDKTHKKYTSILLKSGKQFKKYFKTKEEAIICRLEWEKEHFKDFAPQKHLFEEYGLIDKDFISIENINKECQNILNDIRKENEIKELYEGVYMFSSDYKGMKDFIKL